VEHVRAFIAVDLPIATARELARTQAELRAAWEKAGEPRVAWVPVENIHLTLKFLGSVPLPATEAVIDALGVLAAGRRPIRARLRVYEAQTAPLVDYYRKKGLLKEIDGVGSVEEIRCRMLLALGEVGA